MWVTSRASSGVSGAPQQGVLAVAEPFLHHLVAADGEVPHLLRHVAPIGAVIEIDIVGGFTKQGILGFFFRAIEAGEHFAFAGHGHTALAGVTPTGGDA